MEERILSVEDVSYRYPGSNWQLSATSFIVDTGEIIGIIGPNGSGKSTLLKLAAGILAANKGRVFLAGKNIAGIKRRDIAKTMGYLSQNAVGHFDYSVHEVVAMGRFPYLSGPGFLSALDLRIIKQCLLRTGVEQYQRRLLSQLSGGERQRVFFASVLAQEPKILLLDEPTNALDLQYQYQFFSLITDLVAEGMAVVVVTHDLTLASFYCNRLLMMKDGRLYEEGAPAQIFKHEKIKEIYGEGIEIIPHPVSGQPIILPKPVFPKTED